VILPGDRSGVITVILAWLELLVLLLVFAFLVLRHGPG
jgi:hypothetical protein